MMISCENRAVIRFGCLVCYNTIIFIATVMVGCVNLNLLGPGIFSGNIGDSKFDSNTKETLEWFSSTGNILIRCGPIVSFHPSASIKYKTELAWVGSVGIAPIFLLIKIINSSFVNRKIPSALWRVLFLNRLNQYVRELVRRERIRLEAIDLDLVRYPLLEFEPRKQRGWQEFMNQFGWFNFDPLPPSNCLLEL